MQREIDRRTVGTFYASRMELSGHTKRDCLDRMIEIVDELHEQRFTGAASTCKRDYRRNIEWDHAQIVVREYFFEIMRYRLGIGISVDDHAAFSGREFGEWRCLWGATPGRSSDDEPAVLGEILQQFAFGLGWWIEFGSHYRAKLCDCSSIQMGSLYQLIRYLAAGCELQVLVGAILL